MVDLLARKEGGESYDATEFERVMAEAVRDIVARQRACGIDIVSDGEQSKPTLDEVTDDFARYVLGADDDFAKLFVK